MTSNNKDNNNTTYNNNNNSQPTLLRPTQHHHQTNQQLLKLPTSNLTLQIAYRGNHINEIKHAARATNQHIRSNYATFIQNVGRNIYPLIIFTDYEGEDGLNGIGSTLTLYRADGSVIKVSPALHSNYEIYKSCAHIFMGLSVEIGPFLDNESLICQCQPRRKSVGSTTTDLPWRSSLTQYVQQLRIFRQALTNAVEVGMTSADVDNLSVEEKKDEGNNRQNDSSDNTTTTSLSSCSRLPPQLMLDTMNDMLTSVIDYCNSSLSTGVLDIQQWQQLNQINFPRIKQCMKAATQAQADACVKQLVDWREMMGPSEWRELYVVIPTVWAVNAENPRKAMVQQLMDEDRVNTHIITTEYPRNQAEARTLLGRVVGDRGIGRFVFGDDTKEP